MTKMTCIYCHRPLLDDGIVLMDDTGGDTCSVPLDNGSEHSHCRGFDSYYGDPEVCNECKCHKMDHEEVAMSNHDRLCWMGYHPHTGMCFGSLAAVRDDERKKIAQKIEARAGQYGTCAGPGGELAYRDAARIARGGKG